MTERETIELALDETSELRFKVTVQGASGPARVRLVCESGDLGYVFVGHPEGNDEVSFSLPAMKGKIDDGKLCEARVEVMVENRYFTPVEFDVLFKQPVKVVAEAIQSRPRAQKPVEIQVTASKPTVAAKPPVAKPTIKEAIQTKKAQGPTSTTGLDDNAMEEVARSMIRRTLKPGKK